jgi:hypothetical protein
MKTLVLTRSALYRLVWERTLTALGAEMGISDNGLKKICIKHDIPRPPAGFFLMKPDRRERARRPLPNPHYDPTIEIRGKDFDDKSPIDQVRLVIPAKVDPSVSAAIDGYTQHLKANSQVDERGILSARHKPVDALIRCSKAKLSWASEQFKRVLTALMANGVNVEFKETPELNGMRYLEKITVKYERGVFDLRVEETTIRRDRPLTASELREKENAAKHGGYFYYSNRWIFTPTGKPQLVFGYSRRKALSEDIRPIVAKILNDLKKESKRAIRREIDQRRRRAVELLKLRPLRREIWLRRQLTLIEAEVEHWRQTESLRNYIDAVKAAKGDKDVSEWLTIAEALLNQTHPIRSGSFGVRQPLPKYAEIKEIWNNEYAERGW